MADPYAEFSSPATAASPPPDPYSTFSSPVAAPTPRKTIGASMDLSPQRPPLEITVTPKPAPSSGGSPMAPPGTPFWDSIGIGAKTFGSFLGDVVKNAPGDAAHLAGGAVNALAHPVDTANNIGDLIASTAARLEPGPEWQKGPRAALADAVGQQYKDAYGSPEKIVNSLRTKPVTSALDASVVLGGGGGMLAKAPGITGTIGEAMLKTGAAIDPLTQTGNLIVKGTKAAEPVVTNALGLSTGAGADSVRAAGRAGLNAGTEEGAKAATAFTDNMRGNVSVSDIVDQAKSAVAQLRQERSAAYKSGMVDLSKDKRIMDFDPIDEAIGKANDVGRFNRAKIEPAANDINAQMRGIVEDWKNLNPESKIFEDVPKGELTPENFHTPEGIDALKRAIGNLRSATTPHTPERVAADRVYNAIKNEIVAQAPKYAETMEGYGKASDTLGEATRTFSLGERATGDTAARKLLSSMRNNVQTNYGERGRLLNVLADKEPTLPYAIAGQGFNSLAPRGLVGRMSVPIEALAALHNPGVALPMLAASSPRLVGETAYLGGRAAGMMGDAANALHINADTARTAGRVAGEAGNNLSPDSPGAMALAYRKALERKNALAR